MLSLPKRASDHGMVLVRFFECTVVSSLDQSGWRRAAARVDGFLALGNTDLTD